MGSKCSTYLKKRNACNILVGKHQRKKLLVPAPRHRCEDNINIDLRERGYEGVDSTEWGFGPVTVFYEHDGELPSGVKIISWAAYYDPEPWIFPRGSTNVRCPSFERNVLRQKPDTNLRVLKDHASLSSLWISVRPMVPFSATVRFEPWAVCIFIKTNCGTPWIID
jgi:hypothetical protein